MELPPTVAAMCSAGIALFVIGALAARNEFTEARGLDKILALGNLCFAVPLAVFGALHLAGAPLVMDTVPAYMPWRLFWVYFVGGALIAASLSIATGIAARWSGLLFGIMMFLFVAMIHLPGALDDPHNRIVRTIVFREMAFGGAGWILAGIAGGGGNQRFRSLMTAAGRVFVTIALLVFGVEHFLHPTGLPGVPLAKQMPSWLPGRVLIDYVTGAALLAGGGSILLNTRARTVTTCVGGWVLLMVLVIYGPVLMVALSGPDAGGKIVGVNYFADTLLLAGAILALAKATPASAALHT